MSFTWIKEGVDHAWKGWIMKHLDWGPNTSAPYASTTSDEIMAISGANILSAPMASTFHNYGMTWRCCGLEDKLELRMTQM
jgi:hypothetical protein